MSNDFGITLTEPDKFDGVIVKVITYSIPRTLEFKSCPVFPLQPESFTEVWLTETGRQETQADKKTKRVGGSNTFELSYI